MGDRIPSTYSDSAMVSKRKTIDKCGTLKHYPLAMNQNGIKKKTRLSVTGKMGDRIPSTYSDSAMVSKRKTNRRDTFKFQTKKFAHILKNMMISCLRIF